MLSSHYFDSLDKKNLLLVLSMSALASSCRFMTCCIVLFRLVPE